MPQALGNIVVNDTHRQPLDNCGFADARFTNQHRIVFGTAGQNLYGAADFRITADNRVKLAFFGAGGQVYGKFFQTLKRVFRSFGIGQTPLAVCGDRLIELYRINAGRLQQFGRFVACRLCQNLQQAFQRYELVVVLFGKTFGLQQQAAQFLRQRTLHVFTGYGRQLVQF